MVERSRFSLQLALPDWEEGDSEGRRYFYHRETLEVRWQIVTLEHKVPSEQAWGLEI